jgi:O-antigen ligase
VTSPLPRVALLAGLAAASAISIFASQILLAIAFVVLLVLAISGRVPFPKTPMDVPILALVVWTLLSASFALDPAKAHEEAKKLVLFAVFYVAVAATTSNEARERTMSGFLIGSLSLSSLMVMEAVFLGQSDLAHRPQGFLGHYMTASGIVMMAVVVAAARLAFGGRPTRPTARALLPLAAVLLAVVALTLARLTGTATVLVLRLAVVVVTTTAVAVGLSRRPSAPLATALAVILLPVGALALVVSQTRSAWLGTLVGLSLVAILRAPKLLAVLALGIAAVFVLRPGIVRDRLTVTDASSRDRYFMWQAGIDMILERPVFGQGPGMVERNYEKYRWSEAPNSRAPHLHNNFVQIAAERGIPALLIFAWWTGGVAVAAFRELRAGRAHSPARAWPGAAALATVVALLVSGLFEYNLGDSEIIMAALIFFSLPYAVRQERVEAA